MKNWATKINRVVKNLTALYDCEGIEIIPSQLQVWFEHHEDFKNGPCVEFQIAPYGEGPVFNASHYSLKQLSGHCQNLEQLNQDERLSYLKEFFEEV